MKRFCLISFFVFLPVISLSDVFANVTITCETHTVYGIAEWDSYSLTDTATVSGSASWPYPVAEASSSAGGFSVDTMALGGMGGLGGRPDPPFFQAYAESTYIFEILSDGLTLGFTGGGTGGGAGIESQAGFSFYDMTDCLEIDSQSWVAEYGPYPTTWTLDLEEYYTVNPSHQYQLWIWADSCYYGEGCEFGFTSALNVSVGSVGSVEIIPGPGSLLLVSIGIGFVTLLRKHRAL